eukprot:6209554-Pleurochrysis_carterae.AAC.2
MTLDNEQPLTGAKQLRAKDCNKGQGSTAKALSEREHEPRARPLQIAQTRDQTQAEPGADELWHRCEWQVAQYSAMLPSTPG